LNSERIEYLIVGGYAVSYHGAPRATGDLDVWVAVNLQNAERLVAAMEKFGFERGTLDRDAFMQPGRVIRMGIPPVRIEILTGVSGIDFAAAYADRAAATLDGVDVSMISLEHLKANKAAAGRPRDRDDLTRLP
jgi:predicted nucleotidyltransferase